MQKAMAFDWSTVLPRWHRLLLAAKPGRTAIEGALL
jgi:hypothetical protein